MNEVFCSRQRRQYWPAGEICILFEWDKTESCILPINTKATNVPGDPLQKMALNEITFISLKV